MVTPNGTHDARCWYVVHTKPKQERRAELNLLGWGLEVLAPKVREERYRPLSGRASYTIEPLFPRYLLVHFDAAALLTKVRLTRGVHSVIGFGEWATPVDDSIIEAIRGRMKDDGFVRIEEPRPGEPVRIVEGPMRTLTGIFQRRSGHDRAVILLEAIGAQARVDVAMAAIRRVPSVA